MQSVIEAEPACVNHPDTPTGVKCSKCLAPICLKCAVRTDVGMRCADCAGVKAGRGGFYVPSVLAEVSARQLLLAIGAGLAVAAVGGVAWGALRFAGEFGDWSFWFSLAISIAAGEAIGRVTNERRGPKLQAVAAVSVALAGIIALAWQAFYEYKLGSLAQLLETIGEPFGRLSLGLTLPNALFLVAGMIFAAWRLKL
ncbi:MAG TPA: hypothetical protein VGE07_15235 [Herpetosiphonaceae bacterium]